MKCAMEKANGQTIQQIHLQNMMFAHIARENDNGNV